MMCIHDHPAVHPSTEQLKKPSQHIPTLSESAGIFHQIQLKTQRWFTTGTGFTPPLALSHQSNEKHVGRRENPQPPQTMDIPIYRYTPNPILAGWYPVRALKIVRHTHFSMCIISSTPIQSSLFENTPIPFY